MGGMSAYIQSEQVCHIRRESSMSIENRRKEEIQRVKQLGEMIGYGNMMDIASALWALKLEKAYGFSSGAHIPTVEPFLTEEGKA